MFSINLPTNLIPISPKKSNIGKIQEEISTENITVDKKYSTESMRHMTHKDGQKLRME